MTDLNRAFISVALAVLVGVLLVGAGAYKLYNGAQLPVPGSFATTTETNIKNEESAQPKPNTLGEWQTYSNQELGFSMQYPSVYQVQADDANLSDSRWVTTNLLQIYNPQDTSRYEFHVIPLKILLSRQPLVSKGPWYTSTEELKNEDPDKQYRAEGQLISLGSLSAIYRASPPEDEDGAEDAPVDRYTFIHDNLVYDVYAKGDDEYVRRVVETIKFNSGNITGVAMPGPTGKCGLLVDSPRMNTSATFPVTIRGYIDNTNATRLGCAWGMLEGEAGSVRLYFNYQNKGWKPLGLAVPVPVANWMSSKTTFKVVVSFNNGGIGLPKGTPMKLVFTDATAKDGEVSDVFELPIIFLDSAVNVGI